MFEENLHTIRLFGVAESSPRQLGDGDGEALRALSWQELRARFAAAHDLRRIMEGQGRAHHASFAAGAALHLREYGHGIRDVNPDGLGNSKGHGGTEDCIKQPHNSVARGQDD